MQNNPIGIFDSGVGGLSVLKEIRKILPGESLLYLADSTNCPYGSKTETEAFELARKSIDFLVDQECKLIVIACNTVTAVAIERFRRMFSVPFVGMEPALKPAAMKTRSGKIGVLATENTFKGKLFQNTCEKYGAGIEVIAQPGNGLVERVENGELDSRETKMLLEKYLKPMLDTGADTLVLGCTHYPFLVPAIRQITGKRMNIIDPAGAVAAQTRRILEKRNLTIPKSIRPKYRFCTTRRTPVIERFLSGAMADEQVMVEQVTV